ncbi:hypothetical protein AAIH64_36185, partial [Pseudomonas aeruginosa]|uniref:hypothetical protein n=1 Tax=Pseudomonas aeruginosa TaxID=287 RepID=UPI0031B6C2A9
GGGQAVHAMGVLPTGKRIALPAGYPEARPFFKIPGAMREGGVLLAHIRGEGALAKDQETLNE